MPKAIATALAAFLLLPQPALAANAPRTDPEAGSPSEAIYGIPLEEARREAAPDASDGSAIRSENGVGSSARVPGLEAARGVARAGAKGERPRRALERESRDAAPAAVPAADDPTEAGVVLLVALTILIAAGTGMIAGRRAPRTGASSR